MLERMAAQIFAFHTADVALDRGSSGAEWWVQRRERGDEVGTPIQALTPKVTGAGLTGGMRTTVQWNLIH